MYIQYSQLITCYETDGRKIERRKTFKVYETMETIVSTRYTVMNNV